MNIGDGTMKENNTIISLYSHAAHCPEHFYPDELPTLLGSPIQSKKQFIGLNDEAGRSDINDAIRSRRCHDARKQQQE
jgi:hypothetical protein